MSGFTKVKPLIKPSVLRSNDTITDKAYVEYLKVQGMECYIGIVFHAVIRSEKRHMAVFKIKIVKPVLIWSRIHFD